VFTESFQFFAPEEIDNEYTLGEGKVMVNVGSVGQPRDGDPRACYVILDDGLPPAVPGADLVETSEDDPRSTAIVGPVKLTYRRLAYDFETTIRKIYDINELEPFLGDRLRQGR
jgi:diadenosine tetraphosphatase ApaH/serine/threonine PP2A family protein phosphatase